MPKKEIYTFLIDSIGLLEKHKKELIQKRGFTDDWIAKYKFKSSDSKLVELERTFKEKFPEQDLIDSGVFIKHLKDPTKPSQMTPMLLEERILIPYLDTDGNPYHVRPHKLGFENIPIEIYQSFNVADCPPEIIMTEGEFKAAAGMVFGIPSIAVPGIGSFSEMHFSRLVKFLNDYKIRKVTILYDNEVKDDPNFPRKFKDNPNERYDTQLYAYYMAMKLDREGKDTRIAWFPDGWRRDGKIDLDGALAQGKVAVEIRKLLSDAKTHKEFLRELPKEPKTVITRKLAQKRYRSNITREWGHYVAHRIRGKHIVDEVISNFTLKIIATHETMDGTIREVIFMNEQGKSTSSVLLTADNMVRPDNFAQFCANKGDFVWRGSKDELLTLWEGQFLMMDEGRRIIEPDHIGWVESEKSWLFGNICLIEDGEKMQEIRADKNHTFWVEKKGIRPIPLAVTTGKGMIAEGVPYLNLNHFDIKMVLDRLITTVGESEAKLCMGWVTAVLFMEEIFSRYSCFPFLFITGRRGSGKSTVAEWLMNFFGMENSGKMASETTPVATQRYLAYYSSLPFFMDEYRNTEQIRWKTGLLRNAYNRQSAGKGIREGFGIREAKVRGALMLAGEETPEDSALLNRCIPILVTIKNRIQNHFDWFQINRSKFSYHTIDILRRKKQLIPKFFEVMQEARECKIAQDERTIINYGIVAAGYAVAFDDKDLNFAKLVKDAASMAFHEVYDEQPVVVFLEYLVAMKTKGIIDDRYWALDTNGKIYLYFEGLYNEWSKEYRNTRGILPFKKASIRSYLKEEPGFEQTAYNHAIKGNVKSCVVFNGFDAPELMRNLVGFEQLRQLV